MATLDPAKGNQGLIQPHILDQAKGNQDLILDHAKGNQDVMEVWILGPAKGGQGMLTGLAVKTWCHPMDNPVVPFLR